MTLLEAWKYFFKNIQEYKTTTTLAICTSCLFV